MLSALGTLQTHSGRLGTLPIGMSVVSEPTTSIFPEKSERAYTLFENVTKISSRQIPELKTLIPELKNTTHHTDGRV